MQRIWTIDHLRLLPSEGIFWQIEVRKCVGSDFVEWQRLCQAVDAFHGNTLTRSKMSKFGKFTYKYSGVRGITAQTGESYLSVLISFDKLDNWNFSCSIDACVTEFFDMETKFFFFEES